MAFKKYHNSNGHKATKRQTSKHDRHHYTLTDHPSPLLNVSPDRPLRRLKRKHHTDIVTETFHSGDTLLK